jgi:hypothetical protein
VLVIMDDIANTTGDGHQSAALAGEGRSTDPLALLDDMPLSDDEAHYVAAGGANTTLKVYRPRVSRQPRRTHSANWPQLPTRC